MYKIHETPASLDPIHFHTNYGLMLKVNESLIKREFWSVKGVKNVI
jgi:hypothetical protein